MDADGPQIAFGGEHHRLAMHGREAVVAAVALDFGGGVDRRVTRPQSEYRDCTSWERVAQQLTDRHDWWISFVGAIITQQTRQLKGPGMLI
jgi:hypothetical protein